MPATRRGWHLYLFAIRISAELFLGLLATFRLAGLGLTGLSLRTGARTGVAVRIVSVALVCRLGQILRSRPKTTPHFE